MELLQHVKPALVRHGDIEQHDITWLIFDHTYRFVAIGGFTADCHSSAFRDDPFDSFTHDGVVVDYNNINHWSGVEISIRVPRPGEE